MNKKRLVFFIGIITCLLICTSAFAEKFYIENFNIDLQVNKNKQVHVTEQIDVYFTQSAHGIYREIPHKNATVTNIKVSENNHITESANSTNIRIGNSNILVNGAHSYTISYDYNYLDNKNEFYHNIVGTGWDTYIKHVSFYIAMPETVNPSDVGLSIGKYGTRGFDGGAEFRVNGVNIYGRVYKTLIPKEGVTIRIQVPDGYFNKNKTNTSIFIALICFFTFISFAIWYQFGKDEKAIPVVTFYPPEDMNTLETEIAYKERASTQGLIAMLISLAQRGYIKIYEEAKSFSLENVKPYSGADIMEKEYMAALFSGKARVTKTDLTYSHTFYKYCEDIIKEANSKRNYIYEEMSVNWGLRIIMALCLLIVFAITFLAFNNFSLYSIEKYFFPLAFIIFAVLVVIISNQKNLFLFIWALGFCGIPLFAFRGEFAGIYPGNVPVVIVGVICTVICSICLYHLKKRNKLALKILGELLGFKKFIETADKNKLVQLVVEDPEYFYNVLPYAYIFGISDKWINKFESIMVMNPLWYQGDNFNYRTFHRFSKAMNSVSVPSTQNGGISKSSGGGGFSGGGGGGGGGGSW